MRREYGGTVRIAYLPSRMLAYLSLMDQATETHVRQIWIAEWREEPGAVRMEGVTLEEFEQIRYCSFSPSAGYLRSLVE